MTIHAHLMDESARQIKCVARLQASVEAFLPFLLVEIRLAEIAARLQRQMSDVITWRVDTPTLAALQLKQERVDVVPVRREPR